MQMRLSILVCNRQRDSVANAHDRGARVVRGNELHPLFSACIDFDPIPTLQMYKTMETYN